jgi:molybdopterin/thiamine biosynthesis adenylyltransferase
MHPAYFQTQQQGGIDMGGLEIDRYLGNISLSRISTDGQKKISSSMVSVIGLGGTGGMAAELFARTGVGKIRLIDFDRVSITNLQRQIVYQESDIGNLKPEALGRRIRSVNHNVEVELISEKLTASNDDIIGKPDLIFDGTDNFSARNIVNRYSVKNRIPWIMTAVNETYGTVKAVIPGKTSCISCLGYPESGGENVGCAQSGILSSAPAVVSSMAFSLALRTLLGDQMDGDILYIDIWNLSMERIHNERNPSCPVCGSL